jgi:pimeloyl-ACP methyl ester carboxylesterase
MPSQTLLHNGCTLAYTLRGSGPPVVFIQGAGVPGDGWLPQVRKLEDDFACLTFDNRGIGKSAWVGTRRPWLTVEQMSGDVLALMDAVGWRSAHVVGHSLGGLIAIDIALRNAERVRSLSLLCTFARGWVIGWSPRMLWLGLRSRSGSKRMRRRAFLEMVLPPNALSRNDTDRLAKELEPFFGRDIANQPPGVMNQLQAMQKYDATARLSELARIPTVVVSAMHDPVAPPRLGRELAKRIPGARYVELPNASHGVPIEQPEVINRILLDHVLKEEERWRGDPANAETKWKVEKPGLAKALGFGRARESRPSRG